MRIIAFLLWILVSGLWSLTARSETIKLAWNTNPETNISHYIVSYGKASRAYTVSISTEGTTLTVPDLEFPATYYFAVRAVNDKGLQSDLSEEISYTVPAPAPDDVVLMDRSAWTLTVSSALLGASYLPSNAIDGKADTYWHSQRNGAPTPHWTAVDFGSDRELAGFRIAPRLETQNPSNHALIQDWQLYTSADGETWGEPVAAGKFAHTHEAQQFFLPAAITTRHMRIQLVTGWGEPAPYAWQIAELDAFENPSTPPSAPKELRIILQSSTDLKDWQDIHSLLVARREEEFFRLKIEPPTPTPTP